MGAISHNTLQLFNIHYVALYIYIYIYIYIKSLQSIAVIDCPHFYLYL
jgi:hypothetical protein